MALNDSIREMLAMIELEMRRLKHDRTEIYTRAVQPILWLAVYGTVMSHVRDIPTNGIPISIISLPVCFSNPPSSYLSFTV